MAKLNQQEIDRFLGQPRIAHLVTLRPAGTPHVAPVWFLWDRGRAFVMADANAVKVRNVKRNPAVALSIATSERPLSYIVLEGKADKAQQPCTVSPAANFVSKQCTSRMALYRRWLTGFTLATRASYFQAIRTGRMNSLLSLRKMQRSW